MGEFINFFYLIFGAEIIIVFSALHEASTSDEDDQTFNILSKFNCQDWNATIYVQNNSPLKLLSVRFEIFQEQKDCFSSYEVSLYRLWSGFTEHCDPYKATRILIDVIKQQQNQELSTIFRDLSNGFFCVLITPCTNLKCFVNWSLHSNVANIEENKILKPAETEHHRSPIAEILSVVIILFLTFCLGFWMFWIYKRKNTKKKPSLSIKKSVEESPLLPSENIDIYIFYVQEPETEIKVKLLKDFLKNCAGFNVILIEDVLEQVFIDPVKWLNDTLRFKCSKIGKCNSNKRFIIVQSKSVIHAMEYRRVGIDENLAESTHSLSSYSSDGDIQDNWFHYAVNSISIDWKKAFKDYCHLFVVRFEDLGDDESMDIVRCVRFKLPEHLINLCINLNNSFKNSKLKEQLLLLLDQHAIKKGYYM